MKLSEKGASYIKRHEGFRSKPYLDVGGIPTIGYGNTYYPDGTKVTMNDKELSEGRANVLFQIVVREFEEAVNENVKYCLRQCQFDALVSFCYNVGIAAFKSSTLLKKVNKNPNDRDIAYQFSRWNKAGGKPVIGLINRRFEEAKIYFKCVK